MCSRHRNHCHDGTRYFSSGNVKGLDFDLSGMERLCHAMAGSRVSRWALAKCGIGPAAAAVLASALRRDACAELVECVAGMLDVHPIRWGAYRYRIQGRGWAVRMD